MPFFTISVSNINFEFIIPNVEQVPVKTTRCLWVIHMIDKLS